NKPLSLIYKTSTNPLSIRFATIIQQQLKQVGIELEIHSHDWGTFYGDIKAGRFQMYSLSWVGIKMPDVFRYIFHSASKPPAGANRGRFDDAIVDQLIEQAEAEETLSVRTDIYRAIQQRLHQQLPYIPLWYEDNVLVKRKQISGYTLAADGNYDGLINIQRKPQE
ncbi:MAG: ABC transporter substrate-binding protein, partial [Proteobacteria bacterium]|nr:ABC transporter substrate-binding protein [Pseudomonadota bacterium]